MNVVLDVSEFQAPTQLEVLLASAPDTIAGVYVKLTQGVTYTNPVADAFVKVCANHNTPVGFYHFLTDDDCVAQAHFFASHVANFKPDLRPMVDAESPYSKGAPGVTNFLDALNMPGIIYANYSDTQAYGYHTLGVPMWVAAYGAYDPAYAKMLVDSFNAVLWQYGDTYLGRSQDVSALIGTYARLKIGG